MDKPNSYCEAVERFDINNVHRIYHDTAYGFPIDNDNELFERLVLEINQAGLSWTTILNKQHNFKRAFHNFEVSIVAAYDEHDISRLLSDSGIIRNRLKITSVIHNAQIICQIQHSHGSFKKWLDSHCHLNKQEWIKLFKKTFKFTGGEIVNEFLMSTGYLEGAHIDSCPINKKIQLSKLKCLIP